MRVFIVIDTDDAHEDAAALTPFTLNVYRDEEDGTMSGTSLMIGGEGCLIGAHAPAMLRDLADAWDAALVEQNDGAPLPTTYRADDTPED